MIKLPRIFAAAALASALAWGNSFDRTVMRRTLHRLRPPAPAPAAAEAKPAEAKAPEATLEQRVNAIEAYFQNTDPNAAFKDLKVKQKNIRDG